MALAHNPTPLCNFTLFALKKCTWHFNCKVKSPGPTGQLFAFITCMRDGSEDKLRSRTLQSLLTPVGHRLDREQVGGRRRQTVQPHFTLRLKDRNRKNDYRDGICLFLHVQSNTLAIYQSVLMQIYQLNLDRDHVKSDKNTNDTSAADEVQENLLTLIRRQHHRHRNPSCLHRPSAGLTVQVCSALACCLTDSSLTGSQSIRSVCLRGLVLVTTKR